MKWLVPALALVVALAAIVSTQHTGAQSDSMPLKGKVVMVTGSTDGLGREVAIRSAALGAIVIVHGRNQERGKAVVSEIAKASKGSARFYAADLSSLAEVRTLAQAINRDYQRLDVLVNNDGIWLRDRQVSKEIGRAHV